MRTLPFLLTGVLLLPACGAIPTSEERGAAAAAREQRAVDELSRSGHLRPDHPPFGEFPGGAVALLDEDCDADDDETDQECHYLLVTDDDGSVLGVGAAALATAKHRKALRKRKATAPRSTTAPRRTNAPRPRRTS